MRKLLSAVVVGLFLVTAGANAQQPLTNSEVVKMVQAGLGPELIVAAIRQAPAKNFDVSPDALIKLKADGVSDAVIAVMLGTAGGMPPSAAPVIVPIAPPVLADPNDPLATHEQGIYLDMGEGASPRLVQLIERTPIASTYGGLWKAALTSGLAKTKANYRIRDTRADCRVTVSQPVFYFYTIQPQDFVLLKMKVKGKEREFTSIVMGLTGARSAKGEAELVVEKMRSDIYRAMPATPLPPGEYGIGMPTGYGGGPITVFDFGIDPVQTTRPVR